MDQACYLKISVVIPAFNREKTIKYCLDSVISQTYSPFEVIVVDDCSTDNTVDLVKSYPDERVRCIVLDKNSGAQAARNRGVFESKGDWIAFQDSDDTWTQDKLEKQVQALKQVNYNLWTVVHTNAHYLDAVTGQLTVADCTPVDGENVYSLLLSSPGPLFPTILVSRYAIEHIGYLDEDVPSYQEWDTSIRLAKYCRFIYLKEPLFIYHFHEGETISKDKRRDILGYRYITNKFEQEIKTICGEQVWNNHMLGQLRRCLEFELWSEAEFYFPRITQRNQEYRLFQLSKLLHKSPSKLISVNEQIKSIAGKVGRLSRIMFGRRK